MATDAMVLTRPNATSATEGSIGLTVTACFRWLFVVFGCPVQVNLKPRVSPVVGCTGFHSSHFRSTEVFNSAVARFGRFSEREGG